MKILLNIFLFLLVSLSSLAQIHWTSKNSFPSGGTNAGISFEINGKIYLGLGVLSSGAYTNEFWEYNPSTDNWTKKANYPGSSRYIPSGFAINGKGYVCLGANSSLNVLQECYQYDPSADTWTQMASFPGNARHSAVSFVVGDTAYIGSGSCGGTSCYFSDFWAYIPSSNSWIQRATWPGGNMSDLTAFTIGAYAYVGNGTSPTHTGSNNYYKYNPSSNTWSAIASLPGPAKRITGASTLNGLGYIGCGRNNGTSSGYYYNTFHSYNPSLNIWDSVSVDSFYVGRSGMHFNTIGDSLVYSLCGNTSTGMLSEVWVWNASNITAGIYVPNSINISLYPNPAHATFTINTSEFVGSQECILNIYNSIGYLVYTQQVNSTTMTINANSILRAGTYYLDILDIANGKRGSKIIIIQ